MRNKATRSDSLEDFDLEIFHHGDFSYPVYRQGQGPGVVVIHEVPTITPEVADFSRRVADAGFSVFMPLLMGVAGAPYSLKSAVQQLGLCCIRREFSLFSKDKSSPVSDFLRALSRYVHNKRGGSVGVVGMCLMGNFALSLATDPWVKASVLSQPALPLGLDDASRAALHISDADMAMIKQRANEASLKLLGLRFSEDRMCPKEKFITLKNALGPAFEAIEIDSSLGNPHHNPVLAHSVLTLDLVDIEGHPTQQALQQVLAFLQTRLLPQQDPSQHERQAHIPLREAL